MNRLSDEEILFFTAKPETLPLYEKLREAITDAVRDGTIEEEQLDASVLRILYWKQSLGLLEELS